MYKKQKIHFVGIGGVGMSGIAEVMLNLGYPVSGSDLKASNVTRRLKKKGARIFYGHGRKNVEDADVVVVSSAINKNNPEILAAQTKKIPIIQRAEMLAELMRFSKYGIAVAGTHGKTTTTSLVASVLYEGGYDPTMIIGGKVNSIRANARLGKGDFMVAEADESDGSFLKLSPSIAVITGIDREHMDYYQNFSEVIKTYLTFANKVPFYGAVICCVDHPTVKRLIPKIDKRVITYGFSEEAELNARNLVSKGIQMSYDLFIEGEKRERIILNLAGNHNVLNSLVAIAIALEVGIPLKKVQKALKNFKGIQRRCDVLLNNRSITIIDDYGHHPEEIKVTISAVRQAFNGRLITLFQPHRYTRTHDLFSEFMESFDETNVLLMTDIYSAGETPINGVNAKKLAQAIEENRKRDVFYIPKNKKIVDEVLKFIQPGDVLLSLGAGDVTHIGRECAKRLKSGGGR